MHNYHITAKGEAFVDEFQSHWQGAGDPAIASTFLWWMREDGNFRQHFNEVAERSNEQKALQMVQWAVDKGYLEQTDSGFVSDSEAERIHHYMAGRQVSRPAQSYRVDDFRVASDTGGEDPITDESHITQLRKNLQKPETF